MNMNERIKFNLIYDFIDKEKCMFVTFLNQKDIMDIIYSNANIFNTCVALREGYMSYDDFIKSKKQGFLIVSGVYYHCADDLFNKLLNANH